MVRPNGTPDFLENFSVIAPEAMAISCLNEVSVFCLFIQPVFIKYLFAEHYSRNWEYCFKQDKNLYFPIGDKQDKAQINVQCTKILISSIEK